MFGVSILNKTNAVWFKRMLIKAHYVSRAFCERGCSRLAIGDVDVLKENVSLDVVGSERVGGVVRLLPLWCLCRSRVWLKAVLDKCIVWVHGKVGEEVQE